jgi:L-glyceraldehyde 3-phosphate reductase
MFSIDLKFGQDLGLIAKKSGHTAAQMAIAFNLRRPEVTSALTGPRAVAEIEDTVKGNDWQLTKEEIAEIDKLLEKRQESLKKAQK